MSLALVSWISPRQFKSCLASSSVFLLLSLAVIANARAQGTAVVTNGRFTNLYVYPHSDTQTWEQHIAPLRPGDAAKFSRASIDAFTQQLMSHPWPTYFDPLFQYSGINPPQFFGSAQVSAACFQAAMRDVHTGVMQPDTVRSLANCHTAGMDPSPQINLIFSPDVPVAVFQLVVTSIGGDMCTTTTTNAWHAGGLNVPNFTVIPTEPACTRAPAGLTQFDGFTRAFSHEIVETLSDPAGTGYGTFGSGEVGDLCENLPTGFTTFAGFSLSRYKSDFDNNCQPQLDPPPGSVSETWIMGTGNPLIRFTGSTHTLNLVVPASRVVTAVRATQVLMAVQTGDDDLRGGSNASDNANVTLTFAGGSVVTTNVNTGKNWKNGTTHSFRLNLPATAPPVSSITGVSINTAFGGGLSGDNWNVNKVALLVSFPAGSPTNTPPQTVVHTWLDSSGNPLVRFTGSVHDELLNVSAADAGMNVQSLKLIISTGNDDLRGGSNPGDNCNVLVHLANGQTITINNINGGGTLNNWTDRTVNIPIPSGGLKGGDVKSIDLHTGFGGGIGGDNWNVNRVRLIATLN
jgi:hypothetical protein